jgi:hypothetical protein
MVRRTTDDLFINKLIEETYSFSPDQDISKNPEDLSDYFEELSAQSNIQVHKEKIEEKIAGIIACPLLYSSETKLYRLNIKSNIIDIPSNWSKFSELRRSTLVGENSYFTFGNSNTEFIEVLKILIPSIEGLCILNFNKTPFILFIEDIESFSSESLNELLNLSSIPSSNIALTALSA